MRGVVSGGRAPAVGSSSGCSATEDDALHRLRTYQPRDRLGLMQVLQLDRHLDLRQCGRRVTEGGQDLDVPIEEFLVPDQTGDDMDLLGGLAYDAAGQAGGLSRDDQERLRLLAIRAEVELRRLRELLAAVMWDEVDRDDLLTVVGDAGRGIEWAHSEIGEARGE